MRCGSARMFGQGTPWSVNWLSGVCEGGSRTDQRLAKGCLNLLPDYLILIIGKLIRSSRCLDQVLLARFLK